MKHLNLKSVAIIALFVLSSCQFNTTRINSQKDKREAEKIAHKLHWAIMTKNFAAVYPLFSQSFYKVTDKAQLLKLLIDTQNKLGDMQSDSLAEWQTQVISGTNSSSKYLFEYVNHYQKFKATERLSLSKGDDYIIRIDGYNINSSGFEK